MLIVYLLSLEPLNYSSSQEEVETEDDCCDGPESSHIKDALTGVYDVTSNDEESCHLLQTEDDSENSGIFHSLQFLFLRYHVYALEFFIIMC